VDSRKPLNQCPVCKAMVESTVHCKICNAHMEPELHYKNEPAPAPLPEEVEKARTVLSRVQGVLRDEDLLFAAEGLRVVFKALDSLSRRVAELEAEMEAERKIDATQKQHLLARAESAEARATRAEAMWDKLSEMVNPPGAIAAVQAAEAKASRLGRKLQRVGLHLCETRRKLRKVEGERDAERGKVEAMETGIAVALKQLAAPCGEPCPTCNTYTHKGWCPVPALQDLILGQDIAATEVK